MTQVATSSGVARILFGLLVAVATFASAQPGPRSVAEVLYVPTVDKVLVYGGLISAFPDVSPDDRMWWWDPRTGAWSEGEDSDAPNLHLVFHESSGLVLGYAAQEGEVAGQTWLLDPASGQWEDVSGEEGTRPVTGIAPAFAYDPSTDRSILFGGMDGQTGSFFSTTWEWDMATRSWAKVSTAWTPQGRNFVAFAADPVSGRLVMHGGERVASFLETYDPVARVWHRGSEGPRATPRSPDFAFNKLVYDHDSGKLVHYGGLGDYADGVWIYDVATDAWEELVTDGPAPTQRWAHGMTSVPGLGVVVFGGNLGNTFPEGPATNELWVLNVNEARWELR